MNIVRVKYEKLFPAGVYLNVKYGFEADIEEGEAMLALSDLAKLAEAAHKESYPQYYQDNGELMQQDAAQIQQFPNEKSTHERTLQSLIEEMNKCTSISEKNKLGVEIGLLAWADKCLDEPLFREAYEKKLKELSR